MVLGKLRSWGLALCLEKLGRPGRGGGKREAGRVGWAWVPGAGLCPPQSGRPGSTAQILSDLDLTSQRGGRWRRVNTLMHYNIECGGGGPRRRWGVELAVRLCSQVRDGATLHPVQGGGLPAARGQPAGPAWEA